MDAEWSRAPISHKTDSVELGNYDGNLLILSIYLGAINIIRRIKSLQHCIRIVNGPFRHSIFIRVSITENKSQESFEDH